MSGGHAILAPSSASKWLRCAASPRMEMMHPQPEGKNFYADQGTAAHFLASDTLNKGLFFIPPSRVGMTIHVSDGVAGWRHVVGARVVNEFVIDDEMVSHVSTFLTALEDYKGEDGVGFAEQRLDVSVTTGEEGAHGTADYVVIRGTELQVHDLKYGMGEVEARDNPQLLIYAQAAYEAFSTLFEIETVLIKIHQPRRMMAPEASYTLEEFQRKVQPIAIAAIHANKALNSETLTEDYFTPGEHCTEHYCSARGYCPALAKWCTEGLDEDTTQLSVDRLAELAARTSTIKAWTEVLMARVSELVLSGERVPGFKPVMSREGNRQWDDEALVLETVKGMKIPQAVLFETRLRSAPQMIKQVEEGKIGPKQWQKIEPHVTRSPAKPVVVPESDKRPAIEINAVMDDFEDLID